MGGWRRKDRAATKGARSAIDPLRSPENARAFGVGLGVGKARGDNAIVNGAASLYAKAEQDARKRAGKQRGAQNERGHLPPGAKRAGET